MQKALSSIPYSQHWDIDNIDKKVFYILLVLLDDQEMVIYIYMSRSKSEAFSALASKITKEM
jgi:hypothetical protein